MTKATVIAVERVEPYCPCGQPLPSPIPVGELDTKAIDVECLACRRVVLAQFWRSLTESTWP